MISDLTLSVVLALAAFLISIMGVVISLYTASSIKKHVSLRKAILGILTLLSHVALIILVTKSSFIFSDAGFSISALLESKSLILIISVVAALIPAGITSYVSWRNPKINHLKYKKDLDIFRNGD